jgi:hypothetical protein
VIKCLNIGNLKKLIRAIFLESLLLAKKWYSACKNTQNERF